MQKMGPNTPPKRRDSALGLTRFPSLAQWEDPWEPSLDLRRLRGRAAEFAAIRALAVDPRHEGEAPVVDRDRIRELALELELDEDRTNRLIEDAVLIAERQLLPELLARIHVGRAQLLADLEQASRHAGKLHDFLAPHAREIEDLFQSMPTELGVSDDSDLLALTRAMQRFTEDARRSLAHFTPAGRRREGVRNTALALATWAVEDATGERVRVSRDRAEQPPPHFNSAGGHFVRKLLRLLGHRDEAGLVNAFEKMRRELKATKLR